MSQSNFQVRPQGLYCTHSEALASGFCPDCEQTVNLLPAVGMCMDVAPSYIAACRPAGDPSPWCHFPKGHIGPHRCGDDVWSGHTPSAEG